MLELKNVAQKWLFTGLGLREALAAIHGLPVWELNITKNKTKPTADWVMPSRDAKCT